MATNGKNGHNNGNGQSTGIVPYAVPVQEQLIRWSITRAQARIIRDASETFAWLLSEPPLSRAMLEVAKELDALLDGAS
jgi:hypothetical protein